MNRKLPKNPIKRKREEKRLAKLKKEGRLVRGVEIPEDSIAACPRLQNHWGGYAIKYFYKDIDYQCDGCNQKFTWTAEQQKKYFEVQKGNIYNEPKWCHECHRERMRAKEE